MAMRLTPKQEQAQLTLTGPATHILLEGGSRSGKTSLLIRNIIMRAIKAPGSSHAVLRFRFNHCKASIVLDTFPKIMDLAFRDKNTDAPMPYRFDKKDWYAEIEIGMQSSRIWFGGIDDKNRSEKILGQEHSTIHLNEISQIPYESRGLCVTRIAQAVEQQCVRRSLGQLKNRMYYDHNPTTKAHWSYKMFHLLLDPETRKPLPNPQDYAYFKINPIDNETNLSAGYLDTLRTLSARMRKRFVDGDYQDESENLLFSDIDIEKWRVTDGLLPDMVRIVVGVDPSGSGDTDNTDNDHIGIVVTGLGTDGNAYVLEDCTVKAGPATWGRVAVTAYERHEANTIVGEGNYGGAMVEHVIQTARPRTPYKMVTATRGKHIRAEPFSAFYEQGKVRHVGYYPDMEDEMCHFSTSGYLGSGSPNRADALFWTLSEIFPHMIKERKLPPKGSNAGVARTSFMAD